MNMVTGDVSMLAEDVDILEVGGAVLELEADKVTDWRRESHDRAHL